MSRLVLTQITIKKERSISSTTWYYLLQPSNASAPDPTNYGNPPPTYSTTGYSGWSTTEPTYIVGDDRVLYVMVQTLYSDSTFSYSTPSISSSYEAAKDAYNEIIEAEATIEQFEELGLKKGYIWDNATHVPASGSVPVYPVGTYIASGILVNGNRSITRSNSNTYGLNTWISTGGINLRYNAIDLMKLTTSNLEFYYPSTSSQQKKAISLGTNGAVNSLAFYGFNSDKKTMELTNDGLHFYNPSDGSTELANFTTNGLVLAKGGINIGSYNASATDINQHFVYLSGENYGSNIEINNVTKSDWRQIIGNKFGIDKAGNLYASNVNISGTITATSLIINDNEDGIQAITDAATNALSAKETAEGVLVYDHTYEVQKSGDTVTSITFTAHVYRGGQDVTSEFSDDKFTWYYKNEDNTTEQPLINNTSNNPQNSGKTITISNSTNITLSILKYGVEIIGKFNTGEQQRLLRSNGDTLTDSNNRNLLGVTNETGNSIKVRDLSEITTLYNTDKILIIGPETEQIASLDVLASSLKTSTTPLMNGTAAIGNETKYAAGNHVHPTDTSRAPLASPAFTGTPTAPTAATTTNNTQIATTAFVKNVVGSMTSGVSDVTVDDTSVVTDGIAEIPKATSSQWGVVKVQKGLTEGQNLWMGYIYRDNDTVSFPLMDGDYRIKEAALRIASPSEYGAVRIATEQGGRTAITAKGNDDYTATYKVATVDSSTNKVSTDVLPAATTSSMGAVMLSSGSPSKVTITAESTSYTMPNLDANGRISYSLLPAATTSTQGAMSAADKTKLDNLTPLVSGETIKTINGSSLLGSGNLVISGGSGSGGSILYGTCNTSSSIAEKAVVLVNGSLDSVSIGTQIVVKFTYTNSASNPYLSIDGIDDIYIKKYGTTAPGITSDMSWYAGTAVSFIYDGNYWQMNSWLNTNTTYNIMSDSLAISGVGSGGYLMTSSTLKKAITHHSYPIGSIFETITDVHPNTILYGKWKKISQPPMDSFVFITDDGDSIITNDNNSLEAGFILTNKWVRIS